MFYLLCDDGINRCIRTDLANHTDTNTDGNFGSAKLLLEMVKDDPRDGEVGNLVANVLYYNSNIFSRVVDSAELEIHDRDPIPTNSGILGWHGTDGKVLREKAALILREIKVVQETRYIAHAQDLILHIIANKHYVSVTEFSDAV